MSSKCLVKPSRRTKKNTDVPLVRISKNMSYILRHGASREGLAMRPDGYVRVRDLLSHPNMRNVDFPTLEAIVKADRKQRYHLKLEPGAVTLDGFPDPWWICATQGHSMPEVELDLEPLHTATNLPFVVHGTTEDAWESIQSVGIHRMTRNHIHLATGFEANGVLSGIRESSKVLIYIDVQRAMDAGIKFFTSKNGVVLTSGNSAGYLEPQFFHRVERVGRMIKQIPLDREP